MRALAEARCRAAVPIAAAIRRRGIRPNYACGHRDRCATRCWSATTGIVELLQTATAAFAGRLSLTTRQGLNIGRISAASARRSSSAAMILGRICIEARAMDRRAESDRSVDRHRHRHQRHPAHRRADRATMASETSAASPQDGCARRSAGCARPYAKRLRRKEACAKALGTGVPPACSGATWASAEAASRGSADNGARSEAVAAASDHAVVSGGRGISACDS